MKHEGDSKNAEYSDGRLFNTKTIDLMTTSATKFLEARTDRQWEENVGGNTTKATNMTEFMIL